MRPSSPSREFPVPLELIREITKHLPPTDLQTLCLASRLTRSEAIPFLFGHLRYTDNITPKVRNINLARKDVKGVIKKIELHFFTLECEEYDLNSVIFPFLETLPNLQALSYQQTGQYAQPASETISQLISSVRHAPLLELVIDSYRYGMVQGLPTAGLAGLENFSIGWNMNDSPDEPGSALAHLYEYIRPSLTTLVKLRIDNVPVKLSADVDLQLLKAAGNTLQSFEYILQRCDDSILDTIPEIFPHLTKLRITWGGLNNIFLKHSVLWKDAHINALSKNSNLIDLGLSSDFEENAEDTMQWRASEDVDWLARCYKRRFQATQDIAAACPRLQRCSWLQLAKGYTKYSHPFIVEDRVSGNNVTRVVRGVKQAWMGWEKEGVVMYKPEDLPGDIIIHNDVE